MGDMQHTSPTTTSPEGSLSSLAAEARPDRNRAIDAYRALAMVAVSIGHWAAISGVLEDEGALQAGNALADAPQLAWITWIFQVMPLFFVVGGFSSAMSLDAHAREGGRGADWVTTRLRRMLAPAVVLGATWLGLLLLGASFGFAGIVGAGAVAAAIPLWFLANYTIDTAIAPTVLPRLRRNPAAFVAGALGVFIVVELLHTNGVPAIGHVNWLLFQVLGFAWRDGLLPSGRRLAVMATRLWAAALTAVTVGPWPIPMVHHEGLTHSPTHPPSIALMLFGGAYSLTAVALALRISAWLARSPRAWTAVVPGNAVSPSVYLWHFTAFIVVAAASYSLGVLPTATAASAAWWLQKLPMMIAAALVLAGIVAAVCGVERRALLAPRQPWRGSEALMLLTAALVSAGVEVWGLGSAPVVIAGSVIVLGVWFALLRPPAATETQADVLAGK